MSSLVPQRKLLKIAILGTRGIPANYGGFETFAEELSARLAERGHQVTVYGRPKYSSGLSSYRGVRLIVVPCLLHKYLETVTHTALSIWTALRGGYDIALVCNAANAFLCFLPHLAGQKVVLNVDGIERLRRKWNRLGKTFYRLGEFLSTQLPDATVSDARVVRDYYLREYGLATRFIPYGAPVSRTADCAAVRELGLHPGGYVLYVSRLEPENNARLVLDSYLAARLTIPLVMVGDAPYNEGYIAELKRIAPGNNVLFPGAIYGSGYRQLLSHCLCYVHATEVGGTHPALIEAMGAGCLVVVNDTPENREAAGTAGIFYEFNDLESLRKILVDVCSYPERFEHFRVLAQERVRQEYDWERVTDQYEDLFYELIDE